MTKDEVIKHLQSYFDCEIYGSYENEIKIWYKKFNCSIFFSEKFQHFYFGQIWEGNKTVWSTGEFARSNKLSMDQFINVLSSYYPLRKEIPLF